jgi:Uma2 family endonuclease
LLKSGAHIGHGAIIHGATIGRNCLVGMNSVIMDEVEVGDECIVGALSFIKAGEKIPRRSVVVGNPAKIVKEVSEEMLRWKTEGTAIYQALPGEMYGGWKVCEPRRPGEAGADGGGVEEKEYRPWKESQHEEYRVEEAEANYGYGKRRYTVEDYMQIEAASGQKHEYYNGEIFAMASAKWDHNVIASNLMGLLYPKLKGSPCQVSGSDMRVLVEENGLYTYPDLLIVCGQPVFKDNDEYNLMNPSVLIEVLSPSTRNYDRGDKFNLYQGLSSLKEYLLIDSKSVLVEQFIKNEKGEWILQKYSRSEESFQLETTGTTLSLKEIYDRTQFPKLTH